MISTDGYYPREFFKVIVYDKYYYINKDNKRVSDILPYDKTEDTSRRYDEKEDFLFSICVDDKSIFHNYDGEKVFDTAFDYSENKNVFENNYMCIYGS